MYDCKNCKTCAHAILDTVFGEYKCKKFAVRIYNPGKINCSSYVKKEEK